MMDYKKAGVDIEAGYKSVELMKEYVKVVIHPEVLLMDEPLSNLDAKLRVIVRCRAWIAE